MSRSGDDVEAADRRRNPRLFAETYWWWGPIYAPFHRLADHPPAEQVANVNVVPRVGDRWVQREPAPEGRCGICRVPAQCAGGGRCGQRARRAGGGHPGR